MIEKLQKIATFGGTWVLYLMIALSVVSIALMIERAIFFARRRDDVDALARKVVAALRRNDRREAERLLAASPSIEAAAVRPALEWLDGGPEALEEIVEAEMTAQRRELEWGMTFLGTLGNNAPFVGLLGTVLGVIQAFQQLGGAGQNQGAMGNVMSGIAEALIATGVGLFVALPAVIAYNVAQKRINDVEQGVAQLTKRLLAYLKAEEKLAREYHELGELRPVAHHELEIEREAEPRSGDHYLTAVASDDDAAAELG
jgi:biopolymer transport protein ExbB/biopolymer transport protein TolQ